MKSLDQRPVRVRFAPSPTGHLHIGSLRTALFNWLFARHYNGVFLIRVEDTDVARSTQEFEDSLMQSLAWTGIVADEPIIHQKSRMSIYQDFAMKLLQEGRAYKCFCSEQDLQRKRESAVERLDNYQYDKTCRNFKDSDMVDKPYVVRFKVEVAAEQFVFADAIKGEVSIPADQIDDFVLLRTDGTVTYNFANVIDDNDMQISQVIRGEEHLFNTPKQILLYEAFGYQAPDFAHIPLILGPSGQKLSKRDGATSVVEYKKDGYLPQALCNYLVRLGWSHGDQEIFTQQEMIEHFSLKHINHSGAKFDFEKLKWVNGSYIKSLTPAQLEQFFITDLKKDLSSGASDWTQEQRYAWIALYQDRSSTLKDLYDQVLSAYFLPVSYDWESLNKLIEKDVKVILQLLQQELVSVQIFEKQQLSDGVKAFCKQHEFKMSNIAQLLRFALIGSISGPSVFDMMALLGASEVKKRITVVLAGI